MKNAPAITTSRGRGRTAVGAAKSTRSRTTIPLTPRLHRLACALLRRPHSTRELQDCIPANNAPQYIATLRARCGLAIPCEHIKFTAVDGAPSWFGRYSLTAQDRNTLRKLVGGQR